MFQINQEVCLILMSNIKLKIVDIQDGRYQIEDSKGNREWATEDELQEWVEINER